MNASVSAQAQRAAHFRAMHVADGLVLLPCAWDVSSARIFELEGFEAIGTTSAGIAATLGYRDGQRLDVTDYLAILKRITQCVRVPVSADFEAGYAASVDGVVENTRRLLDAGVIGVNIEDEDHARTASVALEPVPHMLRKIEALRALGVSYGVSFFINAKTDAIWLQAGGSEEASVREAISRANAYGAASADLVFVPGDLDLPLIRRLVSEIHYPLNIVIKAATPAVAVLRETGVKRLSMGSGPMRASLGLARRIAREALSAGTYQSLLDSEIPYAEVTQMFDA